MDSDSKDLVFVFLNKNVFTPSRKRNLTIQVPKRDIENFDLDRGPVSSEYCSKVSPTVSLRVNRDDVKQESYPLPLPPTPISHVSPPKSAAKLPSPPPHSPKGAENVKIPGTSWKKGKLIGKGPLGDVYLGFNRWALLFGCVFMLLLSSAFSILHMGITGNLSLGSLICLCIKVMLITF